MIVRWTRGLMLGWSVVSSFAWADQFHYQNVVLGERAQGLGGAFTAVADDASGVYYNPAGLAFAQSNDISGSANAIYGKIVTYKKTVAESDFVEKSGGTFAPFFGVMQRLDKYVTGLTGGFAYYTMDTELKDQDDLIERPDYSITRFHRAVNHRASTTGASIGFGYRLTPSFSIGGGMTYVQVNELTQDYQDVRTTEQKKSIYPPGTTAEDTERKYTQNIRQRLDAIGVEGSLGVQAAITSSIALGLVVRKGSFVSQRMESTTEAQTTYWSKKTFSTVPFYEGTTTEPTTVKFKKALGSMPLSARAGVAWFANTRLLLSADTIYYSAVTDADRNGPVKFYEKESVTNYAAGGEFFMTPSLPIRMGFFTNNDARPVLSKTSSAQQDHIDYKGMSMFLAWVQPNSQVALGTVLQQGAGEAQKTGTDVIQTVDAFAYTIGFSATTSF